MKVKKLYTYKSKQQIWRILLNESGNFIIETRDADTREVFFNCVERETGKTLFSDFQFEEKSWIGIETIYKDVILFHKYAKPDMPGHREIICFDIATQQILWQEDKLSFLFAYNGQIVCSINTFEGWHFYALDYRTGKMITDYGENAALINQMRNSAEEEKDYSLYKFPEKMSRELVSNIEGNTKIKDIVLHLDIVGDVEYTSHEDLFFMNYHHREPGSAMRNKFAAIDLEKNKIVFEEILNNETKVIVPDCFFVHGNLLILLKERDQIIICRIE
jgi:hypothetical protein